MKIEYYKISSRSNVLPCRVVALCENWCWNGTIPLPRNNDNHYAERRKWAATLEYCSQTEIVKVN